MQDVDEHNLFHELDVINNDSVIDPVEQWFSTPSLPNVKDPLKWWEAQYAGGDATTVAWMRMGLDFLSAPGKYYIFVAT